MRCHKAGRIAGLDRVAQPYGRLALEVGVQVALGLVDYEEPAVSPESRGPVIGVGLLKAFR